MPDRAGGDRTDYSELNENKQAGAYARTAKVRHPPTGNKLSTTGSAKDREEIRDKVGNFLPGRLDGTGHEERRSEFSIRSYDHNLLKLNNLIHVGLSVLAREDGTTRASGKAVQY